MLYCSKTNVVAKTFDRSCDTGFTLRTLTKTPGKTQLQATKTVPVSKGNKVLYKNLQQELSTVVAEMSNRPTAKWTEKWGLLMPLSMK